MSGLRTWSWQICLPKILSGLGSQLLLLRRKNNLRSTFTTSKPPSQVWDDWEWFQWVSLPAPSWVSMMRLAAPPSDHKVRMWWDALPQFVWTSLGLDRSAIKSDFSQPILISCVEPIGRDMQLCVITKIPTITQCPHKRAHRLKNGINTDKTA